MFRKPSVIHNIFFTAHTYFHQFHKKSEEIHTKKGWSRFKRSNSAPILKYLIVLISNYSGNGVMGEISCFPMNFH